VDSLQASGERLRAGIDLARPYRRWRISTGTPPGPSPPARLPLIGRRQREQGERSVRGRSRRVRESLLRPAYFATDLLSFSVSVSLLDPAEDLISSVSFAGRNWRLYSSGGLVWSASRDHQLDRVSLASGYLSSVSNEMKREG
jgi:hypothetical protein